jgi:hypothetical protein
MKLGFMPTMLSQHELVPVWFWTAALGKDLQSSFIYSSDNEEQQK